MTTLLMRRIAAPVILLSVCAPLHAADQCADSPCNASVAVDISAAANMGLVDEYYGDKKGGWTDQGAGKDLSGLPLGEFMFGELAFDIANPAANEGKSVIMLAGGDRMYFPEEVVVDVDSSTESKYLYVLHSGAWMPQAGTMVGKIKVSYDDGTRRIFKVETGRELADWWNPMTLENGFVAWTKSSRGGKLGLYVSEFELSGKRVKSITFSSAKKAAWGIVGVTLSKRQYEMPRSQPMVAMPGEDWRPVKSSLDVASGSALDLSAHLDGPAGKHGFVQVDEDGHFYFEKAPQERVVFYGTNLCYSANFPEKKDAARIAESLAAYGYNVVRFHHYDDMMTQKSADSMTPDPDMLDRMEYLIAECQKRGMYIMIDLFTYRQIRLGEIPEINEPIRSGFKALPPVLPSAYENWKTFAERVMTHVNPYTGKALKDDPALVGICPVNEDPLGTVWKDSPAIAKLYEGLFEEWKQENSVNPQGWAEEQQAASRFLNGIQLKGDRMYEDYLKNELGVKVPLTGTNCLVAISLTEPRSRYDYVDNHIYWDHPEFPGQWWTLPYRYTQLSAVEAEAFFPRTLFPARIAGRPYTITEWNHCNPNRFRAEGPILMAAYAALQNWDGLYRFAHSHNIDNITSESSANGFDLATDPVSQMAERLGALLYMNGYISPAKGFVSYAVDASNGYDVTSSWGAEGFAEPIEMLGLITGVGSVWAEGKDAVDGPLTGSTRFAADADYAAPDKGLLPAMQERGVIPEGSFDLEKGIYVSDTGELTLNASEGLFKIVVPEAESFTASRAGHYEGELVSVDLSGAGATTLALVSLDGKPVAESRHMLLFHLPEQVNTGASFANSDMRLLTDWGKLPHLVRVSKAEIRVSKSQSGLSAYVLGLDGKRKGVVAVKSLAEGGFSLLLDNSVGSEAPMVYEIVAE
ncbi:MAG: cellulase family glycosylhydrolase [Opitutales bacterium]|nr:cellulase family glycosylhydrolase [Opitutales bacterium]